MIANQTVTRFLMLAVAVVAIGCNRTQSNPSHCPLNRLTFVGHGNPAGAPKSQQLIHWMVYNAVAMRAKVAFVHR